MTLAGGITVAQEGRILSVKRPSDSNDDKALHGLTRSLVRNMVQGVTRGFKKTLQIVGVGYRARVEGKDLVLQLGLSHPVTYPIPAGITIKVGKDNVIDIEGNDKQLVGQVAADIRAFYPPEPYKGKGVRYKDEWVRRKAGKAAATG
jgi:large subunit ribosomal protein L6